MPVYCSEMFIEKTVGDLVKALTENQIPYEIILINDGSPDGTWQVLQELHRQNPCIRILSLMRNFSEHNAVMAGLNHARGDYAVIMDDDGQNPPSGVLKLIEKMQEGYDVVFGKYLTKKHSLFRNVGSRFNDWTATNFLGKPKDLYFCSFKIVNRKLIDEIIRYVGPFPFVEGLIFRSTRKIGTVEVEHRERISGQSTYNLKRLVALWLNMFTNFSILPLRLSIVLGGFFALFGMVMAVCLAVSRIFFATFPVGWASLIVGICLFSGIQLMVIGVIGEYVGRIFLSINLTPQFIVREKIGFSYEPGDVKEVQHK
ncbi:glycosyltransferase [bacterium]|nr:glycosyltransferase [bacterium]